MYYYSHFDMLSARYVTAIKEKRGGGGGNLKLTRKP